MQQAVHIFYIYLSISLFKSVVKAELISNLGFSIDTGDDCELYENSCVQSTGFSSKQRYNSLDSCNITVIYGRDAWLWISGHAYEIEAGLRDYFIISRNKFSKFCADFWSADDETNLVKNGTTIYWKADSENEYLGWRFCLYDRVNGWLLQNETWRQCECAGQDPLGTGYGSFCGDHGDEDVEEKTPWCYTNEELCPDAYRTCLSNGDSIKWFFCYDYTVNQDSAPQLGVILAIGIGFILVLMVFIWMLHQHKVKKKKNTFLDVEITKLGTSKDSKILTVNRVLDTQLKELKLYEFKDQLRFTNRHFKQWSFGSMSLCYGPEESMPLVVKHYTKKYEEMEPKEKQQLINMLRLSSKLRHKNVVRCFGFIFEPEIGIIYEYCIIGTCIEARDNGLMAILTDEERLEILIKASHGLIYLVTQGILHLDIGAWNILLDEFLQAKVTGFERSRKELPGKVYISEEMSQSLKRLAPETRVESICSKKTDVWAFGVTIWEIMTNQEPYPNPEEDCDSLLREGRNLPLSSIPYPSLQKLLLSCWEINPNTRPTMKSIGVILENTVLPEVINCKEVIPISSRVSIPSPSNDKNKEIVAKYRYEKERILKSQNSRSFEHLNFVAPTTEIAINNAGADALAQYQVSSPCSPHKPLESVYANSSNAIHSHSIGSKQRPSSVVENYYELP